MTDNSQPIEVEPSGSDGEKHYQNLNLTQYN